MTRTLWITIVLAAAACGGKSKSEPAAEPAPQPMADTGEHGKLTPELDAFHEVLAPRWHADKGPQRMKDTCGAIADFQGKAAAIKGAAAPANTDAAAWTQAGTRLDGAVAKLATSCQDKNEAAFETAFGAVHDEFHHAMELVAGEHDKAGEHPH